MPEKKDKKFKEDFSEGFASGTSKKFWDGFDGKKDLKVEGLLFTGMGLCKSKIGIVEGKERISRFLSVEKEDFKWLGDWNIVYLDGYPVSPCIIWRVGTLKKKNDDGENIFVGTYTIGGKQGVTVVSDDVVREIQGKLHTTFLLGCQLMSKINPMCHAETLMIIPEPPAWMMKELEEKGCKGIKVNDAQKMVKEQEES